MGFAYFKENYGQIAIDLSKQTNFKNPQQINFIGKLENENKGASIFFIAVTGGNTDIKLAFKNCANFDRN